MAAPPTVDLTAASSVLRHLATELEGVKPSFLVLGEEPDAGIRENIRAAGAQWVLWAPFDDAELRLLVNSSMALPEELVQRKDPRVPTNLMAWVRAGSRRDVGVISDLSPRGAFIELSDPLPAGARLRVEFVLPTGRVRSFASVVHQRPDDPRRPAWTPRGMGVLFDPLEPHSGGVIREFVLERSARYQP